MESKCHFKRKFNHLRRGLEQLINCIFEGCSIFHFFPNEKMKLAVKKGISSKEGSFSVSTL